MTAIVLRGDARALPLPDASVDLVVTSPPYHGLRSYSDGGQHYQGQIGDEPNDEEYLRNLLLVHAECSRVLKPGGSVFWNLGDRYGPNKSLLMLPSRFADAVRRGLGGDARIVRAEIIWSKPNGLLLPESVTDRVRRSHEQWFHFVRQPRYFTAVDTIREEYAPGDQRRSTIGALRAAKVSPMAGAVLDHESGSPLGKLPGSVWTIPTEPLNVPAYLGISHYAAFPSELPRRIIQGWSPSGICTACGEGRRPVHDGSEKYLHRPSGAKYLDNPSEGLVYGNKTSNIRTVHRITGEACACPDTTAPTRPALVVDPFGGTGTTSLIASVLGRTGISVDASYDYCRLARWRTTDPDQWAKAMRVEKPPKQLEGQLDMFGEAAS